MSSPTWSLDWIIDLGATFHIISYHGEWMSNFNRSIAGEIVMAINQKIRSTGVENIKIIFLPGENNIKTIKDVILVPVGRMTQKIYYCYY